MTDKRKFNQGRPKKTGPKCDIQKHLFIDQKTANKLAQLAMDNGLSESAVIRHLIMWNTRSTFQKTLFNGLLDPERITTTQHGE